MKHIVINSNYYTENIVYFLSELSNAIRGYPLDGCRFDVPSPFQGVVYQEMNRPMDENADRTFKVNGVFNSFTYWNYNREPSANDQLRQALQWTDFANVVSQNFNSNLGSPVRFYVSLVAVTQTIDDGGIRGGQWEGAEEMIR